MASTGPYPDGAFFAVHKGYKTGVFRTFREFKCHTSGFPNEISAVFDDADSASAFVRDGNPPAGVEPLVPNAHASRRLSDGRTAAIHSAVATPSRPQPTRISIARDSTRTPEPLPTPQASPDRSLPAPAESSSQPTRSDSHSSSPGRAYASQRVPSTPHKPVKVEPQSDEGDTEPEDESHGPVLESMTPVSGPRPGAPAPGPRSASLSSITPGRTTPGRKVSAVSISSALRREMSSWASFPRITDSPTATAVSSTGSPTKRTIKSEPAAHTTALKTPEPSPERATERRMRECTHCSGTGRVACSDSEDETSQPSGSKRRAGSPTTDRRPKRLSDGRRAEVNTKPSGDKGKGKARALEKPDSEPRTPTVSSKDRYM
ncbi:hypothetical protein RhiJN_23277 [Ceratobasidium sp. AG-Ba]|nr:hypothetical protein RhiJN_23277 [Ceratobasidium sp. AG-Ba]